METLTLKKEIQLVAEDDLSRIELKYEGNVIGVADFATEGRYIYPESVEIDLSYRGLGLYKDVVDFVIANMENMANVYEFRSVQRTEAANKFWQKYTSVSDYNDDDHESGSQEQIVIDSEWNVSYR
jgi:hypothetical protein